MSRDVERSHTQVGINLYILVHCSKAFVTTSWVKQRSVLSFSELAVMAFNWAVYSPYWGCLQCLASSPLMEGKYFQSICKFLSSCDSLLIDQGKQKAN